MRYGSVCSGIEAATAAWHPLGWEPAWFSEIEKFPSAVLAHHYPNVPNLGDMTKIHESEVFRGSAIDLLVGGTPCQSFSVAGLRKGLDDPRGNLALVYLGLADRARPRWLVWENVPGVLSSNGGRDFGAFLGALGELGYGFAYRVLDAQYFGLAQRRRRVFVVAHSGGCWQRAAAVLFESHSLSGHPAPSREAGARVAPTLEAGANRTGGPRPPGSTVDTAECLIPFDTTQITSAVNRNNPQPGDPRHPLARGAHAPAIAFQERGREGGRTLEWQGDIAYALTAPSGGGRQQERCIAFNARQDPISEAELMQPLGAKDLGHGLAVPQGVRRLTPRECERLQGFPDDFTAVPYRGKPAADGPRYKALGNSMAVPVMAWIGRRIAEVDALG